MKEIPLSQGKVAIVDDSDFVYLSQYKWCAFKHRHTWYAVRNFTVDGKRRHVRMHRMILNVEAAVLVDHRDGDGLNNQRYNLRACTNSQNQQNRRTITSKSGYKGVWWDRSCGKWEAKIGKKNLGKYSSPELAGMAYDKAARKLFGEFAATNEEIHAGSSRQKGGGG
jgi:hypothetical protein